MPGIHGCAAADYYKNNVSCLFKAVCNVGRSPHLHGAMASLLRLSILLSGVVGLSAAQLILCARQRSAGASWMPVPVYLSPAGENGSTAAAVGIIISQPGIRDGGLLTGGASVTPHTVTINPGGDFKICGFGPRQHRLIASLRMPNSPLFYQLREVMIKDEDLSGIELHTTAGTRLTGRMEWATKEESPPKLEIWAELRPAHRITFANERYSGGFRVPAEFVFPNILLDEYGVITRFNHPGVYVKEIRYGGRSIQGEPLRIGTSMDGQLVVLLGSDGGTLGATVRDKDGKPISGVSVVIMPSDVRSEAELAERLISGVTDEAGSYANRSVPPGKYLVIPAQFRPDPSVDRISQLWALRQKAKPIEVPAKGSVYVELDAPQL